MVDHSRTRPLILGADRPVTEAVSVVRSPFDGREVGVVSVGDPAHIERAVAAARQAAADGTLPAHQRAGVLDAAAAALADRAEEFAQRICAEAAKPIATARIEVSRAVDTLRFSAAEARGLRGEVIDLSASAAGMGKTAFVRRVPIGVIAAISPFNFPLNLVCHKVGPAVAAGCPVVLKPSSATPLTALALAEMLIDECGLPPGWLNVVTTSGHTARHLVGHDDVAMITFTGSPEVGWGIRAAAPRKKVGLELGNNAPVIIEADADWRRAVSKLRMAGFAFAGQTCISTQRVYVHQSIVDDVTAALVDEVESLVVGDPFDPSTEVSALIEEAEAARVVRWIDDAVAGGATIESGGGRERSLVTPTVLSGVTAEMSVCRDEVFGPVVSVIGYADLEDALAAANDTRYGLQAAIFTSSLSVALRAAEALDFGGVMVNETPSWRADHMPYGGVRDSGNTREGPRSAVAEMTEPRLVVMEP